MLRGVGSYAETEPSTSEDAQPLPGIQVGIFYWQEDFSENNPFLGGGAGRSATSAAKRPGVGHACDFKLKNFHLGKTRAADFLKEVERISSWRSFTAACGQAIQEANIACLEAAASGPVMFISKVN